MNMTVLYCILYPYNMACKIAVSRLLNKGPIIESRCSDIVALKRGESSTVFLPVSLQIYVCVTYKEDASSSS